MKKLPVLFCLILSAGCIREVNFEPQQAPKNIAVYGRITDSPGPEVLNIYQTGAFSSQEKQRLVVGASAIIRDDLGNSEQYMETEPGIYILNKTKVTGIPGRSYELEIVLPGGGTIRSFPEKMPQPVPVDSLHKSLDGTQFFTAYVDTKIPAGGDTWLRWEASRIYMHREINKNVVLNMPFAPPPKVCYFWEPFDRQKSNIFHIDEQDTYQLAGQPVGSTKVDERFYERSCIQLYQFSTTAASYEFWRDVDKASNPEGTIFDTPPAVIRGNLFDENDTNAAILGYFEAVAVDTARVFVSRDELAPVNVPDPCRRDYQINSFQNYGFPASCLDCLILPGATLEKPWFW